jgi:hypothetical protein
MSSNTAMRLKGPLSMADITAIPLHSADLADVQHAAVGGNATANARLFLAGLVVDGSDLSQLAAHVARRRARNSRTVSP